MLSPYRGSLREARSPPGFVNGRSSIRPCQAKLPEPSGARPVSRARPVIARSSAVVVGGRGQHAGILRVARDSDSGLLALPGVLRGVELAGLGDDRAGAAPHAGYGSGQGAGYVPLLAAQHDASLDNHILRARQSSAPASTAARYRQVR